MALIDDFQKASEKVKTLNSKPSNNELLELYALFKQATQGNVEGEKPGRLNFKERAKYEAWEQKKDLSKDKAMTDYISFVDSLFKKQA